MVMVPLQLSTDKNSLMFPKLTQAGKEIREQNTIQNLLKDVAFAEFDSINVLPLIYDEKKQQCNILVFDWERCSE